jgi:hypothetical protein
MRLTSGGLILAATDLSNFLSCRYRTALEMAEAHGKHRRPRWDDPLLEILFQRGLDHEKTYVESLRALGIAPGVLVEHLVGASARRWRSVHLMLSSTSRRSLAPKADRVESCS